MINRKIEDIYYDYYTNTESYVKTIVELLPNNVLRDGEKEAIKTLYNHFLNKFDENKRGEIAYVSSAFINKISNSSQEEVDMMINYIYKYFIKNMIYDFVNREKLFDIMNESVKVNVGFYSAYQSVCIDNTGEVRIEKGSYR